MKYVFKGNLRGYICNDCLLPLNNVKVLVYNARDTKNETVLATAAAKETFHQLDGKEVKAKIKTVIAEATPDVNGNFEFTLSDKDYKGGALDIDFECGSVPFKWPHPVRVEQELWFHITTLQPTWRQGRDENTMSFAWEYILSSAYFCRILSLYRAYIICGRIVNCETRQPLDNIKVAAFDVDLLQDDALGSGITNTDGKFMIFYQEADFSKTIFNWLNVEWPAGPDIYFKFYDALNNTLIMAENRNVGHTPGRENRGNCFCVDNLCLKFKRPDRPGDGDVVPAFFNKVGYYNIDDSIVPGISNATGRTNEGQDNAFTGYMRLNGNLPPGNSANAVEYRFLIDKLDGSPPFVVPTAWIAPTLIGSLIKNITPLHPWLPPVRTEEFWLNNPGAPNNVMPDADGWIKAPRIWDNRVDIGAGMFLPTMDGQYTSLLYLDSTKLVNLSFDLNLPAPPHKAGDTLSPSDRFPGPDKVFRIIAEWRDQSAIVPNPNPVAQNILQKINIWNGSFTYLRHPHWNASNGAHVGVNMIDVLEVEVTDTGCGKVNNLVTLEYSCYHPYIASITGRIEGPTTPGIPISFTITPNALTHEASGSMPFDFTGKPNCAYLAKVATHYRLTTGYGRNDRGDLWDEDYLAFCKG